MAKLRGEVYEVDLNPPNGFELSKMRPALIIQNDIGNTLSPVTIIVPISSVKEITRPLPIMVFLPAGEGGLTKESYIDCGQILTVDKNLRIKKRLGKLSASRMEEVDNAIRISLDLL